MKKGNRRETPHPAVAALFFILLLLLSASLPGGCTFTGPGRIVARVNDRPITRSELDQRIRLLKFIYGPDAQAELTGKDARQRVLAMMVEETLLVQNAAAKKLRPHPQKVKTQNELIFQFLSDRFGSTERLEEELERAGLERTDVSDYVERLVLLETLYQEVTEEVEVTKEEVREYYERNRDEFEIPDLLKIRRVLVKDRATAERLRNEALAGADLAELARINSSREEDRRTAGNLGYLMAGQLPPEVERVVTGLPPGEISQIVKVEDGYAFFRLEDVIESEQPGFEEIFPAVEERTLIAKQSRFFDNYVKDLAGKHDIFIDQQIS